MPKWLQLVFRFFLDRLATRYFWIAFSAVWLLLQSPSTFFLVVLLPSTVAFLLHWWTSRSRAARRAASFPALDGIKTQRILLDGSHNFRCLGGLVTENGKYRVRKGLLFRSDAHRNSQRDVKCLRDDLKLRSILDLRDHPEIDAAKRSERLDQWPSKDCANKHLPVAEQCTIIKHGGLARLLLSGGLDDHVAQSMATFTKNLVDISANHWAKMFDFLIDKPELYLPMCIHCTAGKDRTGVAVMLILVALGVSEEDVLDDYELSNVYNARTMEKNMFWVSAKP
jgi:protein-tyrosine phosphatase